jgi:hypothetical protein
MMANNLPEYMRDLVANVGDKLVADIVNDFRTYTPGPSAGKASKVTVQGAGTVQTGDDGPAHRPFEQGQGGWVKPPQVDQWKPPGLEAMDAMMDQQDAIDKAARVKELIEAAAALAALKPREPEDKT